MSSTVATHAQWFVVRCQTKREHIAAANLRNLNGVEAFCPRLRYRKATRRGKIWWVESMFPGYVMAKFSIAEMERAVTFCQGVRGLVRFGSEIPPVPDSFVDSIKREILNHKGSIDEEVMSLSPTIEIGDEVEIAHGPLQGMHGTIVAVPNSVERVKVLLEFLGSPQTVDMDLFSLLLPRRPSQ
jgi:transcriptional antiterminator RfaH